MSKTAVERKGIKNIRALERLLKRMFKNDVLLEEGPGYFVFLDRLQKIHILGYTTPEEEKELIKRYETVLGGEKSKNDNI